MTIVQFLAVSGEPKTSYMVTNHSTKLRKLSLLIRSRKPWNQAGSNGVGARSFQLEILNDSAEAKFVPFHQQRMPSHIYARNILPGGVSDSNTTVSMGWIIVLKCKLLRIYHTLFVVRVKTFQPSLVFKQFSSKAWLTPVDFGEWWSLHAT